MSKSKLGTIELGALADPLADQLSEQGLELPATAVDVWQRKADALCLVRDLFSEREYEKASYKFISRFAEVIRHHNPPKTEEE